MKNIITILALIASFSAFSGESCWVDHNGEIHCSSSGDITPHW